MERELLELLAANRTGRIADRRGWRCPNETRLAAYVDGSLDRASRQALEQHLTDCSDCISQVSFLVRTHDSSEFDELPASLKVKAKALVQPKSKPRFVIDWRWATAALAACLVVSALLLLAIRTRHSTAVDNTHLAAATPLNSPAEGSPQPSPARNPDIVAIDKAPVVRPSPGRSNSQDSTPSVRKSSADNKSLELLAPREGALLKRESIEVSWQTVPDVVFYEVFVKDASGEVVSRKQTEAAELKLPVGIHGPAATKYFVSVNAHLRDGRILRSSIRSVTVAR